MKKLSLTIFAAFIVGTICFGGAVTAKAATWNETKSITMTEGAFTYDAYLSQDGKESWIYKVTVKPENGDEKVLDFPKKVQGAAVTKLGYKSKETAKDEININGGYVETYHGVDGYKAELKGIKEINIPNTVNELTYYTFSGFRNVKKINLPEGIIELPSATFYGCSRLEELNIPVNLKKIGYEVFGKCKKLKAVAFGSKLKKLSQRQLDNTSIKKITISKKNPYLMAKKGAIYNKKGTYLYAVLPSVKQLHIGKKVKSIAIDKDKKAGKYLSDGFLDITNKKITISSKNKVFAKKGKCIYNKKNGTLLYYLSSKKNIQIAKGVTQIMDVKFGENTSYSNYVILPKTLKKLDLRVLPVSEGYLHKIVFNSKVKIENKNKICAWSDTEKVKIVVPKKLKKYYKKQFKKYKKHCKVVAAY